MTTPPPLPGPRPAASPPPLPAPVQAPRREPSAMDDYLRLRRRIVWFVPPLLVGIPAGLLREEWIAVASRQVDSSQMFYGMLLFACCGLVGIGYFMIYLLRRPELAVVAGL